MLIGNLKLITKEKNKTNFNMKHFLLLLSFIFCFLFSCMVKKDSYNNLIKGEWVSEFQNDQIILKFGMNTVDYIYKSKFEVNRLSWNYSIKTDTLVFYKKNNADNHRISVLTEDTLILKPFEVEEDIQIIDDVSFRKKK